MRSMSGDRDLAWVLGVTAALSLSTGCGLLSGLSELKVGDGGGTTTSTGGSGATGGTTSTGGGGAAGGTTSSGATCTDGEQNGDETAIDCGGSCPGCALGSGCAVNADCESGICRVDVASGNPDKQCVGVTAIAAGSAHACAVLSTKELFCWGANTHGQLGNGNNLPGFTPVKVNVPGALAVAAGGRPDDKGLAHTCVQTIDGSVYCWGANGSGQLGNGNQQDLNQPQLTAILSSAKAVSAGGETTCAIEMDDSVTCWGANAYGQLADGTTMLSTTPKKLAPAISATAISAGVRHVCAVLQDQTVTCWGNNDRGETGSSTLAPAAPPGPVPIVAGAQVIRAAADYTCAIDAAGLACWGDNLDGQLTGAAIGELTSDPVALDVTGAVDVAAGSDGDAEPNDPNGGHACAVIAGGKVLCWGNNRHGQLGRGTTSETEAVPAEIAGLTGVVAITAGAEITCARFESGAAACWGRNDQGQLGTGQMVDSESSPVPIAWP